jgi:hypothetical protein
VDRQDNLYECCFPSQSNFRAFVDVDLKKKQDGSFFTEEEVHMVDSVLQGELRGVLEAVEGGNFLVGCSSGYGIVIRPKPEDKAKGRPAIKCERGFISSWRVYFTERYGSMEDIAAWVKVKVAEPLRAKLAPILDPLVPGINWDKLVDYTVYRTNRKLRCVGSTKDDEDRKLRPVPQLCTTEFKVKDTFVSYVPVGCISLPPAPPKRTAQGVGKRGDVASRPSRPLGRTPPKPGVELMSAGTYARVQAVIDVLTPARMQDYNTALIVIFALKATEDTDRCRALAHAACRRATNYDADWVDTSFTAGDASRGLTLGTLMYIAKECNPEGYEVLGKDTSFKEEMERALVDHAFGFNPDTSPIPVHVLKSSRYLAIPPELLNCPNLVIMSALGTGKTQALLAMIREHPELSVLYVCARRTYTRSVHKEFGEALAFVSYLDPKFRGDKLRQATRVFCQVESLHRLAEPGVYETTQHFGLVIIDESEGCLRQAACATTNQGNHYANLRILDYVMRNARYVRLADAFLGERSVHFLAKTRGVEGSALVVNPYQPYNRTAIEVKTAADLANAVAKSLAEGRKVFCPYGSQTQANALFETLRNKFPTKRLALYSGVNEAGEADKELLGDVHAAWGQLDGVITTSCITVGINYDPRTADGEVDTARCFDELFVYSVSMGASPRDIFQSTLRPRHLNLDRMTFTLAVGAPNLRMPEAIRVDFEILSNLRRAFAASAGPRLSQDPMPDWVPFIFHATAVEQVASQGAHKTLFHRYLHATGYNVAVPAEDLEKEDMVKLALVKAGPPAFAEVPDLSHDEANELKLRRMAGYQAERLQIHAQDKFFHTRVARGDTPAEEQLMWDQYLQGRRADKEAGIKAVDKFAVRESGSNMYLEHRTTTKKAMLDLVKEDMARAAFHAELMSTRSLRLDMLRNMYGVLGLQNSGTEGSWTTQQLSAKLPELERVLANWTAVFELRDQSKAGARRSPEASMASRISRIMEKWSGGTWRSAEQDTGYLYTWVPNAVWWRATRVREAPKPEWPAE